MRVVGGLVAVPKAASRDMIELVAHAEALTTAVRESTLHGLHTEEVQRFRSLEASLSESIAQLNSRVVSRQAESMKGAHMVNFFMEVLLDY